MKTKLLVPVLLLLSVGAAAQTSRQEMSREPGRTGGSYFAYPGPAQKALTPAPAGYEPFYISHYGRHGSRYILDNKYYRLVIGKLDTAATLGILSARGADLLQKLQKAYADACQRDGELTALGGRQHRDIARRMYGRFPSLLSRPLQVDARSSTVGRCMLSMFYFTQELLEQNPGLEIRMDASKRDMPFVVENSRARIKKEPATEQYKAQVDAMQAQAINPARLMKSLFTDVSKAESFVDGKQFMQALWDLVQDQQNVPEVGIDLSGIYTREELFQLWNAGNASWLYRFGLVPGSTPNYLKQASVLDSLQAAADRVISEGGYGLSLRFSHDSSVLPLTYLMGLKEAMGARSGDLENLYKTISIDKLIPMAANIQLVFYRKEGSEDILVKFLLNENETTLPGLPATQAPFYRWTDVKSYWDSRREHTCK